MTPYYSEDGITIYHGDCLEVLPTLSGVDLAVTSPPYNIAGDLSGGWYQNMKGGYASHADDLPDDRYVEWQRDVIAATWTALSADGAIFYNHKPLLMDGTLVLPLRLVPSTVPLRQIIIWDRRVGMNWNASHFCPQHEWILLLAKPTFRLASRSHSTPGDVWELGIEQSESGHPCPYPLMLPKTAIGATHAVSVLDPFMGSGTTLVAAKSLSRKAIGIEIEERYCEIAAKRLAQGVLPLAG